MIVSATEGPTVDRLDYAAAGVPVREDLQEAHAQLWEHLRSPGAWWTGAQRVAIAAESRHAEHCALCRQRKAALSPAQVKGAHESLGTLPPRAVDVIHRVRTDPGRLSRSWFEEVTREDLDVPAYVELVGLVAMVAGVDAFTRALGMPRYPLPEPRAGEPSRRRPASARPGGAWVPMIAPEDADGPEADLYEGVAVVPNIVRALSLFPDAVRMLQKLSASHYMTVAQIPDPTVRRSLDRMQMELVASRVSALNECFY